MKKINFLAVTLSISIGLMSCSSSATDEFEDVNGEVSKKKLKKITTNENGKELSSTFFYDANAKLEKIEGGNGIETSSFQYTNTGRLVNVSGNNANETLNVETLYQSPYKAFEAGEVIDYDSRKNPSKILFRTEKYNYTTGESETITMTAELEYDEAPNLYFSTLESAGIIDILDGVQLDFSSAGQSSEIIKARRLLPLNNVKSIVYKNENNEVTATVDVSYTYDSDNYPTKAIALLTSGNETESTAVSFSYE